MEDLATKAVLSRGTEHLRGLIDFARDVLKSVTLINGGAAIALLAFAGSVLSDPDSSPNINAEMITWGLGTFAAGVFCAGAGSLTGYVSQYFYFGVSMRHTPKKWPLYWHLCTLILIGTSFISFVVGVLLSMCAFFG